MKSIKTKDKSNIFVKTLDKSLILADKTKESLILTKEKVNNVNNKESQIEYASNKVKQGTKNTIRIGKNTVRKEVKKTPKRIQKTAKKTKKVANKGIKTTKKVTESSIKVAKKSIQVTKIAIKETVKVTKITIKATIAAIKAIVEGTKALVTAIAAGGWVAVIIIVIISVIGVLCGSIFGLFFSNDIEDKNNIGINSIINELNIELENKIESIKKKHSNQKIEIVYNGAEWKDILAIYTVKVSDGDYDSSTGIIDKEKQKILKQVFWDMNEVVYLDKLKTGKIEVRGKTIEQMKIKYNLTEKQMKQINELMSSKYNNLWAQVFYGGTSIVGKGNWAWPTIKNYVITEYYGYGVRSSIGETNSRLHAGVDIAGLGCNSPIYAAQSGKIEIAGTYSGYGNAVIINHNNGYKSLYGHMNRILVKTGASVNKGEQIGLMGNTGYSFGCHLHFQVEKNGKTFDPLSLY